MRPAPHASLPARAAMAAAALLSALPAHAQAPAGAPPGQTPGLSGPRLPPPTAPVIAAPPSPAPPTGAPSAVLIPSLKGLFFVSGSQALAPDGVSVAAAGPDGLATPKLPILNDPRFKAEMKAHLGQPFRLSDLQRVRAQTKAWYTAHKRPFVEVTVPPQNISSGVVQVVVSEYRLGDVRVTGERYFSKRLLLGQVDLNTGQTIGLPQLNDNIERLNDNPFVTVDAEFKPGADPGSTDLILRAKDRFPVRVYAGYDNEGVPSLDTQEWNVGVNWGNAFGNGQILSYQYTRAFNGRFESHSGSDVVRVDNADQVLLFANYATTRSTALLGPFALDADGHAFQASVRLVHSLPRILGGALTGHLQLGYDYKSTDNNAFFDQVQLGPPSLMETNQFPLIYDGLETDRFGSTAVENDLVFAPGRLTARDNDADFQTLVAGSRARYVYDRVWVTRTERLPKDFSFVARGILQRASAILPNSEQLGGGGVGSVRGYYPDTGLGSNGELLSLELRSPPFSPGKLLGLPRLKDTAQVGAFYDYASLRQPYYPKDVIFGSANNGTLPVDLASTGVLLRYAVSRHVDVNVDIGWQLRRTPDNAKHGDYAAVALVLSN